MTAKMTRGLASNNLDSAACTIRESRIHSLHGTEAAGRVDRVEARARPALAVDVREPGEGSGHESIRGPWRRETANRIPASDAGSGGRPRVPLGVPYPRSSIRFSAEAGGQDAGGSDGACRGAA